MTLRFLLLNVAVAAILALAPFDPAPGGTTTGDLARSLMTRWLPFAILLSAVTTAVLARKSPRAASLRRGHWWVLFAIPATGSIVTFAHGAPSWLLGAPYVAVVTAVAAGGVAELWRSRAHRTDREIGALLGLVVLMASVALLPYDRTVQLTRSDEPHYLLMMESLVQDRDLDLKNNYDNADYADYYPEPLPDRHVIISGPRHLPIRDLGYPIIGAVPFAIARRTGVLLLMCLAGAAFAWRGYAFLRFLAFSRQAALFAAAAASLLHPVFTYTTQIYPDLPAALGVLLVAELLARPPTVPRLAAASAILGALPWLTVRAWFIVVGMGLVVAWIVLRPLLSGITSRRLVLVAAGGVPFVAFVAGLVLLDQLMFGVPVPNAGYYLIRGQQTVLAFTPQIGLPGLLLDRTFGLLSHVPLYALAFFGAVPLLRRARVLRSAGVIALFLGWLGYLLYIGDIQYWWADGSPSSRYQLATIALPMLALAAGLERLRGELARLIVAAAVIWSALITIIFAWQPNLRYDLAVEVEPSAGPGQIWDFVTASLHADPGLIFPSLVHNAPVDVAITLAWTVLLTGLVVLGARRPRGPRAQSPHTMSG